MTKVVVNRRHGGFGLSDKAVRRYAELMGLTLYPEVSRHGFTTWWLVPPDKQPSDDTERWHTMTLEERKASNEAYDKATLTPNDIARDNALLIQVVEELGEGADGEFARLDVTEVPDDVDWQIDEYDGLEWVAEKHRRW